MRNILIGLLLGFALSFSVAAVAFDNTPKVVGDSGFLKGVEVLDNNGKHVCDTPFWYKDGEIISCS